MVRILTLLVHADGAIHLVVEHQNDWIDRMVESGRDFLPRHQKTAIAHKANHCPFGVHNLRTNRGRHRIAHGAIGRAQEILPRPHMHEARGPGCEIAGIGRVNRVRWQRLFQSLQGLRQIKRAFVIGRCRLLHPCGAQIPRPACPGRLLDRRRRLGRCGEGIEVRSNAKRRAIDAPDFRLGKPRELKEALDSYVIGQTKAKKVISDFNNKVGSVDKLSKETLEPIVNDLIKSNDTNFKGVGQPLRIALTGSKFGPGIYDIIISLGKEEVTKRLTNKKFS